MKLSKFEQLAGVLLCDIAEKVGATESVNPALVREAILTGNTWAIEWEYGGLFPERRDDRVVSEVTDILDMWSFIEEASEHKFPGFDTNRESEHASVARFMVEKLKRFDRFDGRTGNGVLNLDWFRRMLPLFNEVRGDLANRQPIQLSKDEVEALIAERTHPDRR
ncbi:hypothetical protein EKJ_07090 [Qipengyuania flava]|uniref:YfbU family protein n=1 Tax=Qipengyuania flava TaxID=192812 RepID=A0A3T1CFX5_9SPHN|nr:YfbU family protein [Qipengyuania flava]BBI19862.1 hypothetical protein EKJ_07090 [Qipengyuania flava]